MAKLTYQPLSDDADTANVDGVDFKAYEAVEIDDVKTDLITKLKRNPWFTAGEVDQERYTQWKAVRDAQAAAAEHRAHADRLENDPTALAEFTSQATAQADSIVADAKAKAALIVADAQTQADGIVAKAKTDADSIVADAKADAAPKVAAVAEPAKEAAAPAPEPAPQPTVSADPNKTLN